MSGMRIASDLNSDLISLFRALQIGWKSPQTITKEHYEFVKENQNYMAPYYRAFVGIGCSFAGKWWGGFASGEGRDFANECYRGLIAQKPLIDSVSFTSCSYADWNPYNMLIYCDPPYADTTPYAATVEFDSEAFWDIMKKWSRQENTIFVSEYSAPPDLTECVYTWETKTTLVHKGSGLPRIDKLFLVKTDI